MTKKPRRLTSASASAKQGLRTAFYRSSDGRFCGFALDNAQPNCRLSIEIFVDGYPVRLIRADALDESLLAEGIGDGCYGFSFVLDEETLDRASVVEARLANLGAVVGAPIALAQALGQPQRDTSKGSLCWLGGLRFSGWAAARDETATADVLVDGILVTRLRATSWTHVGTSQTDARAVRAFDFHLPQRFADATVHRLELLDEAGQGISGRPIVFIAYRDGLREAIAGSGLSEEEKLRAELFDQLLPMSAPFSSYQTWREAYGVASGPPTSLRGAVILVGPGNAEDTLESLHEGTHAHWVAASLPHATEPAELQNEAAQEFLAGEGGNCDFVVFCLAGSHFEASALQRIAHAFAEHPNALAIYADVDMQSDDGSVWPLVFSAFDYERMLEQGFCAHLFALRRSAAARALERGASNLYRVFNSLLDDDIPARTRILHLPGPLATLPRFDVAAAAASLANATSGHLQKRGFPAQISQRPAGVFPAVHVLRHLDHPRTTIIIPTRNRQRLLKDCVDSIEPALKRIKAELLIVDNDSSDPDTVNYLARLEKRKVTVLRCPGEFNFPRLNNSAAAAARGELLCLLNNDIIARDNEWLNEMLSRIVEDDVGAVGAMLISPSEVIQHGGVVLGPNFAAAHAFIDRIEGDYGYAGLLSVAHECSTVTAACLLTRRRDYLAVGGMDELRFPVNFNDVDYCLKLRALGKRIVLTPHAKLMHLESASRGSDLRNEQRRRFERELQNLRAKWGPVLASDPYYSPVLSLDPIPYSALAWPARAMEPRINLPPIPNALPAGF